MKRYFKKHQAKLFLWLLLELISALSLVYWSIFMKTLADTAYGEEGLSGMKSLLFVGATFLLLFMAAEFLGWLFRSQFLRACNISLKQDIFHAITNYNISAFNDVNSAKYISLLNNDAALIDEKCFRLIPTIIANIIVFIVALATMVVYSPWLALVALVCCSLQFIPPLLFSKASSAAQKRRMLSLDNLNATIKDIFTGFEVIKSFRAESHVYRQFSDKVLSTEADAHDMRIQEAKSEAIGKTLSYAGSVLQLSLSVYLILTGEITMGILMGSMQISNYVTNPARNLSGMILNYKTSKPVIERVLAVIDGKANITENSGTKELAEHSDIRVSTLSFSYDGDRTILKDIDFHFESGKKYAIVGSSGSGKSTLIRLLIGYYPDYSGDISYSGMSLQDINKESLYSHVSMIHQKVFLFEDTLRRNITMYGDYSDEEVLSAVTKAGLTGVLEHLGGLDGRIEENGRNLSGGEQQRVAIARAFIRGTDIMLVDEATASLDTQTSKQINDVLMNQKDLTLVAVTHRTDQESLEAYDEVLVLEQGVLLEHAPYRQLSAERRRLLSL